MMAMIVLMTIILSVINENGDHALVGNVRACHQCDPDSYDDVG